MDARDPVLGVRVAHDPDTAHDVPVGARAELRRHDRRDRGQAAVRGGDEPAELAVHGADTGLGGGVVDLRRQDRAGGAGGVHRVEQLRGGEALDWASLVVDVGERVHHPGQAGVAVPVHDIAARVGRVVATEPGGVQERVDDRAAIDGGHPRDRWDGPAPEALTSDDRAPLSGCTIGPARPHRLTRGPGDRAHAGS